MKLSVIVLTHNRRAALESCLNHIKVNSQSDHEVIVVDNGSNDGTREFLEERKGKGQGLIPIHLKSNEGVCARNHAIDIARGEFIAQVDDDVITHPSWDTILLGPMLRDPRIGATGQHGFYQTQSWEPTEYSAGLIDDRRRPAPGQYADLLMGFCYAWRNDRGAVGDYELMSRFRYDESFNPFWHEESDLQLQIRAAGYRIMVTPEVATHNSMHDWTATMANEGVTAVQQAERNFYYLKEKWQNKGVRFEGSLVGLS